MQRERWDEDDCRTEPLGKVCRDSGGSCDASLTRGRCVPRVSARDRADAAVAVDGDAGVPGSDPFGGVLDARRRTADRIHARRSPRARAALHARSRARTPARRPAPSQDRSGGSRARLRRRRPVRRHARRREPPRDRIATPPDAPVPTQRPMWTAASRCATSFRPCRQRPDPDPSGRYSPTGTTTCFRGRPHRGQRRVLSAAASAIEVRDPIRKHRATRPQLIDLVPGQHEDVVRFAEMRPRSLKPLAERQRDTAETGVEQRLFEPRPLAKRHASSGSHRNNTQTARAAARATGEPVS